MIELILSKPYLVFGVGNPLFGDDGFGPKVIEYLESNYTIPHHAACIDVGTSIREILFDILLSPDKPEHIIIVDSADMENRQPGEIFEIQVDHMNLKKTSDYSLHQFPTTNMLKEIADQTRININVLVAQVADIPDQVEPGISEKVNAAIPLMCSKIMKIIHDRSRHD